jgi:hypothetical protein
MTKPVSPLRQRMIDDITLRNMSPNTRKAYIYAVRGMTRGKVRCHHLSFLHS